MATSKAPKHDFAPAWLKVPDQENRKSAGGKASDYIDKSGRPKDFYPNYNGYGGHDFPYGVGLPRQRSFDYYEGGRYPSQKFRHHSVDDDYYNNYGGYPYNYGFEKYGNHYRSQPTLMRDGKYQHPNSRYQGPGPAPHMNGAGYLPYYDAYGYDYFPGDSYYTGYGPRPSGKRPYNKGDKNKEREGKQSMKGELRKEHIDDDFPSLNGENDEVKNVKTSGTGVWEKPLSAKIHANGTDKMERHVNGIDGHKDNGDKTSGNMYRAQVPSKSIQQDSSTAPVQILNSRLMTTPKNLSNKKSDFLKTLKNDVNNQMEVNGEEMIEESEKTQMTNGADIPPDSKIVNGINGMSISPEENFLSSSLEAEQRLLREMGWKEDDEEYEITEDDKKQFQQMSKQISQVKNGLTRRKTLPLVWSPKGPPFPGTIPPDLNDTLSSTSDESDDEFS